MRLPKNSKIEACLVAVAMVLGAVGASPTPAAYAAGVGAQSSPPSSLFVWGDNGFGQLGDGSGLDRDSPVLLTGQLDVIDIAAGDLHSLWLKSDGTVRAAGSNGFGQLGNNSTTSSLTPVVVSGLTGVAAVAASAENSSFSFSLALKNDGTVWAWGNDQAGQLGDGGTTNRSVPVQVSGLTGITAIAAGGAHGVALKSDGTVWAWGPNGVGQMGLGSTDATLHVPAQVPGLAGVTAITAGVAHTLALKGDGTVWAWGSNTAGVLGDGSTTQRTSPTQASIANVSAISTGYLHSLAVKSDGSVWSWGWNTSGQLGDGTLTDHSSPAVVSGVSDASQVAAGFNFSLALLGDGSVLSWGANADGQLGDGTTLSSSQPIESDMAGAVAISAGGISMALHELDSAPTGEFTSLTPARILDTRTSTGGHLAPIGDHEVFGVQVVGQGGVPGSGVEAVVMNVTAVGPSANGYLSIWPAGAAQPLVSNLNFEVGDTIPNLVTVAVGSGGKVNLFNSSGSTHVIFDVVGYYANDTGPLGARFHGVSPFRYFDTRNGDGGVPASPIGPNGTLSFTATGKGGVPASGVTAVVMNVTAVGPTANGYVTVYPGDVGLPLASNLNVERNQTIPNLVTVRVPANGVVKFFNGMSGNNHLIADVVGYYDSDKSTEAGRLITDVPQRVVDTRVSSPFPAPGSIPDHAALSLINIPTYIGAVVMNVTVVGATANGYLTVYPDPGPLPLASNLNFEANQTIPNMVIMKPGGSSNAVNFYNSAGRVHLIVDVSGYFSGANFTASSDGVSAAGTGPGAWGIRRAA